MSVPTDTLWTREPHTAVKHAILRRYLDAWWPIILSGFAAATYAEGFAGPGQYTGGEDGSPLEALHALLDRPTPAPAKPARFVLVEGRADRAAHLRARIATSYPELPAHVDVQVCQGACDAAFLPALDVAGAWGQPVFAMLDPFNADVPYSIVCRLGQNRSTEVMVTFMSTWLTRWAGDEGQEQGDRLFGGREWRAVADQPTERKKAFLVSLYRRRLTEAGFGFQLAFELVNPRGVDFFLVFATGSQLGVEKMKDAMWASDRVHGLRFRDPRSPDQLSFDIVDDPDLRGLAALLAGRLSDGEPATVEELRAWTLLETAYRPPHAQQVLRGWAGAQLEVVGGGRLLKRSTVRLRQRPPDGPPPAPTLW